MEKEVRTSIKFWAQDDRPREKLMMKGRESLSNAELLAVLLGSGNKDESAVELSQRILQSVDNSLNKLGRCSVSDLVSSFRGIGEAKAITIIAALELGRRRKAEPSSERVIISSSDAIFQEMQGLADLDHEELWILMLDKSLAIQRKWRAFIGGVDVSIFDIRLVMKELITSLTTAVVMVHNHPSGRKSPSAQDESITKKLKSACELFNIRLIDHVIIAGDSYYSFMQSGKL
ncbi:MAG: DNA repair protein RadC [Paludibacteraceae bacterium]|nr:DNA repair protein RadC [Paludibacteraceae bacterium]